MAITMLVNDDPHAASAQVALFTFTELSRAGGALRSTGSRRGTLLW
jgi:hypothetical protein